MRVCVTERHDCPVTDMRPTGELAPTLALPWIAKLRDGVLIGEVLLVVLAHYLFRMNLPIRWLALPLSVSAASSVLLHCFMKPFSARPALGLLLAFDIICLTALLAFSGGPANPFSVLYLVEITLSAVVLSKSWTWILGALSVAGFGLLFSAHLVGMWIAFTVGTLLITVFIGKVSEALRRQEQEAMEYQRRLAHHERLAAIATLAAGAAHELGTPLATIAVASRDLELGGKGACPDGNIAEDARLIRSEVDRCGQILRHMGGRSAEPGGEMPVFTSLREICGQVKADLPIGKSGLLRTAVTEETTAFLPASATRQALSALVKNALDSSPSGQCVTLAAKSDSGSVIFTVEDSGCGMSPETLNRVTEPFFTTKCSGRGLGLGTFLVRLFAERLNGNLICESELGRGTSAILELPLHCHDGKR